MELPLIVLQPGRPNCVMRKGSLYNLTIEPTFQAMNDESITRPDLFAETDLEMPVIMRSWQPLREHY